MHLHVIGTAGHIDHGKSTLVHALTGIDPDRLAEEKRRGMTIELGFAWLRLPSGREASVVDVPGHERFIRHMLAGAGGVDVALLVVAADEGVMPQTREHIRGLQTHKSKLERAAPGGRVAVNLAGVSVDELARGDVLTLPGAIPPAVRLDVRLRAVGALEAPLTHNMPVTVHTGAAEVA